MLAPRVPGSHAGPVKCCRALALLLLCAPACGDDAGSNAEPADTGIPITQSGATAADDGDGADDDAEKLDTPSGDGTGAGAEGSLEDGCEKVDFLFVIDSSGSMVDEQDNLLASFPGFIAAIEDTLMFDDFHLMVVDAGLIAGQGCDGQLGAGRVTSSLGQDCALAGGLRYTTQDQPDLVSAFTCIASRGSDGPGNEQTMDSMLASIGPLTGPGQCNEGFLRDDAVLVITIISDEEDSGADGTQNPPLDGSCSPADSDPNSQGDPQAWIDAVVAAKSGDPNAVVVLSLVGDCDAGGTCPGIALGNPLDPLGSVTGAEPAPRLRAFTIGFQYGSIGPVCAPDYAPFFEDAVSVIASACDDFVPPG